MPKLVRLPLGGDDKLEKLVETIIQRNVAGFCVQETWRLGNFITTIRGHTVIHHGMEKKKNIKGIISAGVSVILNPVLTKAWSRAGKIPLITSSNSHNFPGRMIEVTIFSLAGRTEQRTHTAKKQIKV